MRLKRQLQGHTLVMRRPPTCMQELSTPVVPLLYRRTPVACVTISPRARKFCYINIVQIITPTSKKSGFIYSEHLIMVRLFNFRILYLNGFKNSLFMDVRAIFVLRLLCIFIAICPLLYSLTYIQFWPIPVLARSKAWVWGRLPTEIAGSNIAGGL